MTEFPLSPREKAMLRRLAKGWSTVDIRASIGGTLDQVQEQQSRLLRKLRINTQKELVDAATRLARHRSEKGTPYNKHYKRR
jgi:DNA-binding CsgD family transcriptional regulator